MSKPFSGFWPVLTSAMAAGAIGATSASAAVVTLVEDGAVAVGATSGAWNTTYTNTPGVFRAGKVGASDLRRGYLRFTVTLDPNEVITGATLSVTGFANTTNLDPTDAVSLYHAVNDNNANAAAAGLGYVFSSNDYVDTGKDVLVGNNTLNQVYNVDVTSELLAEMGAGPGPAGPTVVAFRLQLDGDLALIPGSTGAGGSVFKSPRWYDSGGDGQATPNPAQFPTLNLTTTVIPEPASLALGALGALAMLRRRGR